MFQSSRGKMTLILALLSVYICWGGTYLGIKVALESFPPFLMGGIRFCIAGTILYAFARWRGAPKPSLVHWKGALIIGFLLLICGNGGVVWAEQTVDSGITALLVATEPIWIVMLAWLVFRDKKPGLGVFAGVFLGFIGMLALIWDTIGFSGSLGNLPGVIVINLAAVAWAVGSLLSRNLQLPDSPILSTGMEMLWGGLMFMVISIFLGEPARFAWSAVTPVAAFSLLYLIFFGSLIAFTSYIWLLRHATPALASTYAYVNPVVAVFLGWALGGERFGPGTVIGGGIIVVAIILITGMFNKKQELVSEEPELL